MTAGKSASFAGMISARRKESDRKQAATASTINRLLLNGTLISISAVADGAGVSRNFIYSHENLLHQLEAARQTQRDASVPRQRPPSHGPPGRAALQSELTAISGRHQLCLGKQVDALAESENPQTATALENDRLTTENRLLHARIEALKHRVNDLQDDLTAERRSTAEVVIHH
jgi:cell division protein FtsB